MPCAQPPRSGLAELPDMQALPAGNRFGARGAPPGGGEVQRLSERVPARRAGHPGVVAQFRHPWVVDEAHRRDRTGQEASAHVASQVVDGQDLHAQSILPEH